MRHFMEGRNKSLVSDITKSGREGGGGDRERETSM